MDEIFIQEYFTALATRAKYLMHEPNSPAFFRIKSKSDPDEFDNAVKNVRKSSVLLLELGSGELGADDTPRDDVRIGLHILKKTNESFEQINSARKSAKADLIKIIACMKRDSSDRYVYTDDEMGPLKTQNIRFDGKAKYDDMDGIAGNWYGKCIYFDWKIDISMAYDPNDYNG